MGYYWFVLIMFLVIVGVIGVFSARKSNQVNDMALGGRSLGPIVVAATWAATQMSAATFLGGPGMVYSGGWSSFIWGLTGIMPGIAIAWLILPKKLRVISERVDAVTVPGLLLARYQSKAYNGFFALMMLIAYVPVIAAQISAVGTTFQAIFGVDYKLGILIFGGLVVVYTGVGGYLAVCYTDFVQAIFMLSALFVVVPSALSMAGGLTQINATLAAMDPGYLSPYGSGGSWTMMLIVSWMIYYSFQCMGQPYTIVRYLSVKNVKSLKLGYVLSIGLHTFICFSMGLIGLAARCIFTELPMGQDYALVEMLKVSVHPLVGGLMVAGIFAACMSTVDSALHVVGTAISRDFYKTLIKPDCTPRQESRFFILGAGAVGIASLAMAFNPPPSVMALLTYGVATLIAMTFMPLVCGLYWKRFNTKAAFASSIVGGGLSLFWFVVMGGTASGIHPAGVAIPASIIVGIVVALATKPQSEEVLEPFFRKEPKRIRTSGPAKEAQ